MNRRQNLDNSESLVAHFDMLHTRAMHHVESGGSLQDARDHIEDVIAHLGPLLASPAVLSEEHRSHLQTIHDHLVDTAHQIALDPASFEDEESELMECTHLNRIYHGNRGRPAFDIPPQVTHRHFAHRFPSVGV